MKHFGMQFIPTEYVVHTKSIHTTVILRYETFSYELHTLPLLAKYVHHTTKISAL